MSTHTLTRNPVRTDLTPVPTRTSRRWALAGVGAGLAGIGVIVTSGMVNAVYDPEVADDWAAMVRELVDRHYAQVVRYSTSGFLRAKLGPALAARGVAAHLYESADQARAGLKRP